MEANSRRKRTELAVVLSEAERLLDEQRRALQAADFGSLLGTTVAFQRLAEQLGATDRDSRPPVQLAEVQTLRRRLAAHQSILEAALAATAVATHSSPRASVPAPGRSLLLDHRT